MFFYKVRISWVVIIWTGEELNAIVYIKIAKQTEANNEQTMNKQITKQTHKMVDVFFKQ